MSEFARRTRGRAAPMQTAARSSLAPLTGFTERVPYGYRLGDDGKLIEDEREQEEVALAKRLRAEGASLRGVGRGLEEAGFWPRPGKKWLVAVLSRLLSR